MGSQRQRAPVAIAGHGAVTALGRGLEPLRAGLKANASGLRSSRRFQSPRFQADIVGAAPDEFYGEDRDPAFRLASEAGREACRQAAQALHKFPRERIGLVLSTTKANLEALEILSANEPCPAAARRHLEGDLLATDLAADLGAAGPVRCVSLACVSGLIAIQQGARLIQRGAADAVVVVGVDHLSAFVVAGFSSLKALDPTGCRPFDRDRCGLSPGEAGAALVLVRDEGAPKRAIRILGWGGSNDANHMTGPSRDGSGLARAIHAALQAASLVPGSIHYINAHGTGTPFNDAMESEALRTIFGRSCPPVSASKGMLGHTLGAAGVVETILCVLAFEDRVLPGTPRLQVPAEGAPASLVREPRAAQELDFVLKLNTGFGGTNGALVLGRG